MKEKISSYFELEQLNMNMEREMLASFTAFISMAYILFVNPTVLGASSMDGGAVFTVTALASALSCILMGVLVKYPIATAPALGIGAFFAYSVSVGMEVPWRTTLASVFVASLIFILITIFKLHELIIDTIPADLKFAILGGIGLFITFFGLSQGSLIVANDVTLVGLGPLNVGSTWVTIVNLVVTTILLVCRVPGGILIRTATSTIAGLATGVIPMPDKIISSMPSLEPTFLVALGHVKDINTIQMWVVILTFLLVTFFDTAGTLVGLVNQASFMKDNKMPHMGKALAADSTATLASSLLRTSSVGAYIESSTGIAVGGRSGITAITTGILFIFGLLLSPLLAVVTSRVTAPALIIVGALMAQSLDKIKWNEMRIAIPSLLILLGMPLTYSTSDGITLGFIFYPITMITAKRGKGVSPIMYDSFFVFVGFIWILNTQ